MNVPKPVGELNRRGFWAASLGELQPQKHGGFQSQRACSRRPHSWNFGYENAVCSVCGFTVAKTMVEVLDAKWKRK